MIEVLELTKLFGSKRALHNVSFHIARGECVGLAGPNGAGKTTLLRILATLAQPDKGSLVLAGCHLPQEAAALRRELGMIGHQTWLFNDLTARQNLVFYSRLYGIKKSQERIDELLRTMGIFGYAEREVRTFSRGMQQRLSIARALLNQPSILLMDEPFTGLDDDAVMILDGIIREMQSNGSTILLASHDLERVEKIATRFLILGDGMLLGDLKDHDTAERGLPAIYRDLVKSSGANP